MAKRQTIIWTALPHGISGPLAVGSTLRLSAFVTPQLWNTDKTVTQMSLSEFPDWLDWPERVGAMTFEVEFDGGVVLPATLQPGTDLRLDLWQALFDGTTPVFPYNFEEDDFSKWGILVLETSKLHEFLVDTYGRVGSDQNAGTKLPTINQLADDPGIRDIARETRPAPRYEPPPRPREPIPAPNLPGEVGCGCIGFIILFLRWLFRLFGIRTPQLISPRPATARPIVTDSAPTQSVAPIVEPSISPTLSVFAESDESNAPPPIAIAPASVPTMQTSYKSTFEATDMYFKTDATKFQGLPNKTQLTEQYDFHQRVSLLGDYPMLLRKLGLVVDLLVAFDPAIPTTPDATVKIRATWTPTLSETTSTSVRTHYLLEDEKYCARPKDENTATGQISNGLVRVNAPSRYQISQVDVAGSAIKIRNAATNIIVANDPARRPQLEPTENGLPALQTDGIAVIQPNIVEDFKLSFKWAKGLYAHVWSEQRKTDPTLPALTPDPEAPTSDEVWAENLVRGYRVDVFDVEENQWFSLHQRDERYDFLNLLPNPTGTLIASDQEGFVQPNLTKQPDQPKELRAHETIFSWQGWSLSAPRPNRAIIVDDQSQTPPVDHLDSEPLYGLKTWLRVHEGTLPRLRYGRRYRLRARIVDLAGNSVFEPDDAKFQTLPAETTDVISYGRFEVLSPPTLMLREKVSDGESVERMVIRSEYNSSQTEIEKQSNERHVVPPKSSAASAEQHAKFDGTPEGPNVVLGDSATKDLASREAGTLTHTLNLTTNTLEILAGAEEIVLKDDAGQETARYWIQKSEQFPVSFLPDPFARGALFLALPGMGADEIIEPGANIVNKLPFDGTFPNALPFRIRIVGIPDKQTPAKPKWENALGERVLVVEVPQAGTYFVQYSSYMSPDDATQMGVFDWIQKFNAPNLAQIIANTKKGQHWMFMPYRTLVLVHGVKQPLAIPKITALTSDKLKPTKTSAVGETSAILQGKFALDARSTGKIAMRADWRDPFDDVTKPTFDEAKDVIAFSGQVGDVQILKTNDDAPKFTLTHSIGDTKFHRILYTPTATTRFREYFPPPTKPEALVRPTQQEIDADAAAPLSAAKPTEEAKIEIEILNSGHPDLPKIHSVIPTFKWQEKVKTNGSQQTIERERIGSGLRVYLERPWFSTGWGELLGVVFAPNVPFGDLSDEMKILVTHVAADPLFHSKPPKSAITQAHFEIPAEEMERRFNGSVTLAENKAKVAVAGYDVIFDETRQLWYGDLEFAHLKDYFPFIRLALARFQPRSVPDAHISSIVRAEYAQVVPTRRAVYRFDHNASKMSLDVVVEGVTFTQSDLSRHFWIGAVEAREAGLRSDLGWKQIANLKPQTLSPGEIYHGVLDLIQPFAADAYRVVIREYEGFVADDKDLFVPMSTLVPENYGYRVVYADARVII